MEALVFTEDTPSMHMQNLHDIIRVIIFIIRIITAIRVTVILIIFFIITCCVAVVMTTTS